MTRLGFEFTPRATLFRAWLAELQTPPERLPAFGNSISNCLNSSGMSCRVSPNPHQSVLLSTWFVDRGPTAGITMIKSFRTKQTILLFFCIPAPITYGFYIQEFKRTYISIVTWTPTWDKDMTPFLWCPIYKSSEQCIVPAIYSLCNLRELLTSLHSLNCKIELTTILISQRC